MTYYRNRALPVDIHLEGDSESLVPAEPSAADVIAAEVEETKEHLPTFRVHSSHHPEPASRPLGRTHNRRTRREHPHRGWSQIDSNGRQALAAIFGAAVVLLFLYVRQGPVSLGTKQSGVASEPRVEQPGEVNGANGEAKKDPAPSDALPRGGWRLHSEDHLAQAANQNCWSLHEKARLYPPSRDHTEPSPGLLEALRRYEELHKSCVAGLSRSGWEQHFEKLLPGFQHCRYLLWREPNTGLGTRLLSLLSAFLYAVLTERVLLVDTTGDLASLLCEPFPRSSWWLPSDFWPEALQVAPHQGEYVNGSTSNWVFKPTHRRDVVAAFLHGGHWEADFQFFCDSMQGILWNATWMSFYSNQYIVPGLFLLPSFQSRLSTLFPTRVVLPLLARYLLHPTNPIWERVVRVHGGYLQHADHRVGIHVRTYGAGGAAAHQRVLDCATGHGLLPNPMGASDLQSFLMKTAGGHSAALEGGRAASSAASGGGTQADGVAKASPHRLAIFVASTDPDAFLFLKKAFSERPTEDHSLVTVFSESHEESSSAALTQDQKALAEIWLLSLSDALLISYRSAFGYLAAGLADQTTFLMNIVDFEDGGHSNHWRTNGKPVCEQAWANEGCQFVLHTNLTCSDDPRGDGARGKIEYHKNNDPGYWLPYVRHCQDDESGLAIVPKLKARRP